MTKNEMSIEEANSKVQYYWDMMELAKDVGNVSDEEYWMWKWSGACDIYEIITGTDSKISK